MAFSEFDRELAPRRRAVSADTLRGRDARLLVAPINEKLGAWQAESVRLTTQAARMKASGRQDPGIVEAIETLLGFVQEQSQRFEALVAEAPAEVAAHSRVSDTRTALAMVVQRLTDALPKV